MELSSNQTAQILNRLPEFENAYETISYKTVSPDYNLAMAVPSGRKAYMWFTFHQANDVCYIIDLNKDKKISKVTRLATTIAPELAYGTILYGTVLLDDTTGHQWFVIEDLFMYKGIALKTYAFGKKLDFLEEFMQNVDRKFKTKTDMLFILPAMWEIVAGNDLPYIIPDEISQNMAYTAHHIQYRALNVIMPYLNVFSNRKINMSVPVSEIKKQITHTFDTVDFKMDFSKPQYKYPTIFQITADIQFDIYHLFAFGKNAKPIYYNTAYVPSYKSSVFLNGLFRKIRENKNIDYIEESDDEDDFQNMSADKYVSINKILYMECVFNYKFKRWTPVKVVNASNKVVHMNKLVKDYM